MVLPASPSVFQPALVRQLSVLSAAPFVFRIQPAWLSALVVQPFFLPPVLSEQSYFGAGGALGFDTIAAFTVLKLKESYHDIRLILVLPCLAQTRGWSREDVEKYEDIKSKADKESRNSIRSAWWKCSTGPPCEIYILREKQPTALRVQQKHRISEHFIHRNSVQTVLE